MSQEAVQLVLPNASPADLPYAQAFDQWKRTAGGNWILERLYRRAAPYAARWRRTGRPVGIRLLWELVRWWDLGALRAAHPEIRKCDGYAMNDHFHAHAARHLMDRRPDWQGLFAERELQKPRHPTREITIRRYG